MPGGHPGCVIATAVYQDCLVDRDVREANRRAVLGWLRRFRAMVDEIVEIYPMNDPVDLDHLADMVSSVIEGGLVMSRAVGIATYDATADFATTLIRKAPVLT